MWWFCTCFQAVTFISFQKTWRISNGPLFLWAMEHSNQQQQSETRYSVVMLKDFSKKIFRSIGCSEEDSELAAINLTSADLAGVDSHGVARLAGYIRLFDLGRVNPKPAIKTVHESPSTLVLDADKALGLVSASYAMDKAIGIAAKIGTGWVAVRNSNHFGIAGQHAKRALDHDMIGIVMTNASPLVAPTYSKERLLGTNPIAVAIPAGKEDPFIADFATTVVANGKLEIYGRAGKEIPFGWAIDKKGNNSSSPNAVKEGGALLPLGGTDTNGSHKGYCLGAIVDIFSGVFSGSNFGPWVPPFVPYGDSSKEQVGEGMGHFFGAMRIDAWQPKEIFKQRMDTWIKRFKESSAIEGKEEVLIPGEPERRVEEIRRKAGIPLQKQVKESLDELADRFGLERLG